MLALAYRLMAVSHLVHFLLATAFLMTFSGCMLIATVLKLLQLKLIVEYNTLVCNALPKWLLDALAKSLVTWKPMALYRDMKDTRVSLFRRSFVCVYVEYDQYETAKQKMIHLVVKEVFRVCGDKGIVFGGAPLWLQYGIPAHDVDIGMPDGMVPQFVEGLESFCSVFRSNKNVPYNLPESYHFYNFVISFKCFIYTVELELDVLTVPDSPDRAFVLPSFLLDSPVNALILSKSQLSIHPGFAEASCIESLLSIDKQVKQMKTTLKTAHVQNGHFYKQVDPYRLVKLHLCKRFRVSIDFAAVEFTARKEDDCMCTICLRTNAALKLDASRGKLDHMEIYQFKISSKITVQKGEDFSHEYGLHAGLFKFKACQCKAYFCAAHLLQYASLGDGNKIACVLCRTNVNRKMVLCDALMHLCHLQISPATASRI